MRISVIISTYNQPQWLENVVWGYTVQTHRDFELVIADDGSTDETRHTHPAVATRNWLGRFGMCGKRIAVFANARS